MDSKITVDFFSKHLFWDVDLNLLDLDKYPEFMVQRVLEYGVFEDWILLKEYYGLEAIKNTSLNLQSLDPVALSFAATIFKIGKKKFAAFDPSKTSADFRRRAMQKTAQEFLPE